MVYSLDMRCPIHPLSSCWSSQGQTSQLLWFNIWYGLIQKTILRVLKSLISISGWLHFFLTIPKCRYKWSLPPKCWSFFCLIYLSHRLQCKINTPISSLIQTIPWLRLFIPLWTISFYVLKDNFLYSKFLYCLSESLYQQQQPVMIF